MSANKASSCPRQRGSNVSYVQRETLMEYMMNHENLRKGAFTKNFTKKDQEMQWQAIADILNAMPGATRTWVQWRKTWQDTRASVKKKYSTIATSRRATGGGLDPNAKPLNNIETKVLEMMGKTIVDGHEDVAESRVEVNFGTVSPSQLPGTSGTSHVVESQTWNVVDDQVDDGDQQPMDEEYLVEPLLGDDEFTGEIEIERRAAETIRKRTELQRSIPAAKNNERRQEDNGTSASATNNVRSRAQQRGNDPSKKGRSTAVKRLNHAISATEVLSDHVKNKMRMKQDYYERKLQLLELQAIALQEIASSVKEVCNVTRNHIQNL